jgi:hypothetical protein
VALGSGSAAAALPELLGSWDSDGNHFRQLFVKHAEGQRAAANAYAQTDQSGADRVEDAGSAF